MKDLVAGRYRVPWESEVVHTDGTSCGFPAPTRKYAEATSQVNAPGPQTLEALS
jgi:formamidase